jgi:hypothetical protein
LLVVDALAVITLSTLVSPVADAPVETEPSVLMVVVTVLTATFVVAGSFALTAAVSDRDPLTALEIVESDDIGVRYLIAYAVLYPSHSLL